MGLTLAVGGLVVATVAGAAEAPVALGTAASFAVLAGAGVTNTGPTVVNGNLGTCPTPAITGFPPGVVNGTIHAADAVACGAKSDLTIAYNDAAGRAPNVTFGGPTDLGGTTRTPGVYKSPSSFAITGTLTLDGQGDPNSVFIFQAGSTLITAPNSHVALINGAQSCNVFWQVGSSATLGVGSTFVGTILALTSITANTNASVQGRLLARNGATTLDSNTVSTPMCAAPVTTTTVAATTTTVAATTTTVATTTTTVPATTTTTAVPATTTTTAVPATTTTTAVPATTTTVMATTTTVHAATTTTVAATTTTTAAAAGGGGTSTGTGGGNTGGGTSTGTGAGAAGGGTSTGTAAVGTGAGSGTGTLPLTGRPSGWNALVGASMVALGSMMVLLAREQPEARRLRRKAHRGRHRRPRRVRIL